MSTILQFAENRNIKLTNDQKDKILSMEVILNLLGNDIETTKLIGSPTLIIRSKLYDYYLYCKSSNSINIEMFGNMSQNMQHKLITTNNLADAIKFCILDLEVKKS